MKIVINDPKSGNSYQKELDKSKQPLLLGKKIGDSIEGGIVGLDGYALQITGGSNKDGFPMKSEIGGQRKVKAYLGRGSGVRGLMKGERRKKSVVGNTISQEIMQVNTKITAPGTKSLEELGFVLAPKEKKPEKEEQTKKQEKTEEKKEEAKKKRTN